VGKSLLPLVLKKAHYGRYSTAYIAGFIFQPDFHRLCAHFARLKVEALIPSFAAPKARLCAKTEVFEENLDRRDSVG